ncbi:hypothetical protein [Streptomyces sp. 8N616]|uniref:hypothetical protein n=1 Tax=Streptomyces sp. 8N616 TaxID=3457414 RepID=UPI003FD06CD9
MLRRPVRPGQERYAADAAPEPPSPFEVGVTRFDVVISRDGSATVNGVSVPVMEEETVNVAILNLLQGYARGRENPVEAVILDEAAGYTVRIEVAPDGSSRLLEQGAEPAPGSVPDSAPHSVPGSVPDFAPHSVPDSVPDSAPHSVPGSAPDFAPEPAPDSADVPPPGGGDGRGREDALPAVLIPRELAESVARVNAAVAAGELERAEELVSHLTESIVRWHGAEHPYTLECHELAAYIAFLRGHHRRSAAISLELAGLRHRQGDPLAREDVIRAASAWRLLRDTPAAIAHGRELVTLRTRLAAQGWLSAADVKLLDRVERRLNRLTTADTALKAAAP